MRLFIILPFLALGLAGCTNQMTGGVDPFFGRTTIAPPATNSSATADPAYSGSAVQPLFSPSSLPASMPAVAKAPEPKALASADITPRYSIHNDTAASHPVPSSTSSVPLNVAPRVAEPINPVSSTSTTTYTPSGNPYSAGSKMGLSPVTLSSNSYRSSSAASGPGPEMTRTRVAPLSLADNRGSTNTFSTPPASKPASSQSGSWTSPGSAQPQRTTTSDGVIDIMDLPPKTSATESAIQNGHTLSDTNVHHDPAVRLASATFVETDSQPQESPYSASSPQSNKPISFTAENKYEHADDYSCLKGRLEYSQARRRWKLRYIPIDGEPDRFGGSVILQNTSLLSGYERGDYVELKGRLYENADAETSGDYAADFEITQIKRAEN